MLRSPDRSRSVQGSASWEPDFWSAIRNATRVELYRAEERAADYGLARLSLQAEIAANYFTLRGYDAQVAIYAQSIDLYKRSLDIVKTQFAGAIASALDVARVESLLYSTETKLAQVRRTTPSDGTSDRHSRQYGAGRIHDQAGR